MSLGDLEKKQIIKALGLHQKRLESMETEIQSIEGMKKQLERIQYDIDFLKNREMKRYKESQYRTVH